MYIYIHTPSTCFKKLQPALVTSEENSEGEFIETTSLACLVFTFPLLIVGTRERDKADKKKDLKNRRCFLLRHKKGIGNEPIHGLIPVCGGINH
jgi:hypothetical protein